MLPSQFVLKMGELAGAAAAGTQAAAAAEGEAGGSSSSSLFASCRAGDAAAVRAFIKAGGEVNVRDGSGLAPLHCALDGGSLEVVSLYVLSKVLVILLPVGTKNS
jgi:ankyrin repeat protein